MQLCSHDNVLLYKRSYYWHKSVYSILEFCNGGSLTSLRKVRLTEPQIRVIFRQLLKGMLKTLQQIECFSRLMN